MSKLEYEREYRRNNLEKVRTIKRNSRSRQYLTVSGRAQQLHSAASARALKHGIPFGLTREWLEERISGGHCALTGLPFDLEPHNPYAPSVDRIEAALGYVPENCRVIINAANLAKNRWSDDVLREWARALLLHGPADKETIH